MTQWLVRQYRPNYFTGFDTAVITVNSFEEITTAPWLENFKHDGFSHFTVEKYYGEHIVSAHYKNGEHWVAAFALEANSDVKVMSTGGGEELLRDNWRYKPHKS